MKLSSVLSSGVLLVASMSLSAGPLAHYDFSSGSFGADFDVHNNDAGVDCDGAGGGCGDVAIVMYGGDNAARIVPPLALVSDTQHKYSFHTNTGAVDRLDNARVTFQIWRDPTIVSWAGAANFGAGGFCKLLGNESSVGITGGSLVSGIGGWSGLPLKHTVTNGWNAGNGIESGGHPAVTGYIASTDRASSVWFRETLGNVDGGHLEGSTDGTTFTTIEDVRGTGADAQSGLDVIFYTHAGTIVIDNLVVEDDNNLIPVEISGYALD